MSSLFRLSAFLPLACLFSPAICQALTTCSQVQSTHPEIEIVFQGQPDYTSINNAYWSTACTAEKPSCIILPTSAQQLADILVILNQNNEPFAIKSGGHTPNCYSSINGGPLIATKRMNQVLYDESSQTVRVGPGNRWMDVTEALLGTGVTVVGGRMGAAGVSGLMLGGIWIFSSQRSDHMSHH
jgi:FAD/FMN-containing dehydrogenase